MRTIHYTDEALRDITDIAAYVGQAAGSRTVGERMSNRLIERCERLVSLPGTMGRPRPELRPDMRSVAFKSYVIFFRYVGNVLEVVNVLEGHRDIDAYYRDDE